MSWLVPSSLYRPCGYFLQMMGMERGSIHSHPRSSPTRSEDRRVAQSSPSVTASAAHATERCNGVGPIKIWDRTSMRSIIFYHESSKTLYINASTSHCQKCILKGNRCQEVQWEWGKKKGGKKMGRILKHSEIQQPARCSVSRSYCTPFCIGGICGGSISLMKITFTTTTLLPMKPTLCNRWALGARVSKFDSIS